MIKKIIFFLILIVFSNNLFASEQKSIRIDVQKFKCDYRGEIPPEEIFQRFNIITEAEKEANKNYIIAELKKNNSAHELFCNNQPIAIEFNYSILENLPVPIKKDLPVPKNEESENKQQSLIINNDDQTNEDDLEEKPLTEGEKKRQEKQKQKEKQIKDEEEKLDKGKVVKSFIENQKDKDENKILFSTSIEELSKKFAQYKENYEESDNFNRTQLEALKTDFQSIKNIIANNYMGLINTYDQIKLFCNELDDFKFKENKSGGKELKNNCKTITEDWTSLNWIKVGKQNFIDYFNLEIYQIDSEIKIYIENIVSKIENIKKAEEKRKEDERKADEKRKEDERKAEEKRKEEERQKKLKEAEEKKKKEEAEKKKEAERQKKLEQKKKEEEEKKKEAERQKELKQIEKDKKDEYENIIVSIEKIEIQELNENFEKLAESYEELSNRDSLSVNIDKDLDNLNEQRAELVSDGIFETIKEVKDNISINELLDEDKKEDLLENLKNNVESKIEKRKKEIDNYIKIIEGKINSQDQAFRSKIDELENRNTLYLFIIIGTIVILGGAIIYLILRRSKDDVPSQTSSIRNTSILQQEIDELKQIIRNSQQQSNVQQTPNVTQQQPQEEVRQPTEQELFAQKLNDLGHDYLDAITDPNKIEGFKEKWQAIGLDRESRVGASTVTTLKKDNRPFERCNFWAVPIRNNYRIFGGRILRTNSVALTADDGRMARDLLTGIFDIEYGTSFQIRQQGVAVMKNQIFEITTKGKITIPKT